MPFSFPFIKQIYVMSILEQTGLIQNQNNSEKTTPFNEIIDGNHEIKQFEEKQNSIQNAKNVFVKVVPFTQEEKSKFAYLYSSNRSKWSRITSMLPNRNEKELKNFFHNNLRKLASKMTKLQRQKGVFQKSILNSDMLHQIIDLSLIIKDYTKKNEMPQKYYLLEIHRLKDQIFDFSFGDQEISNEKLWEMTRLVRQLKFRYKNLKFKRKYSYTQQQITRIVKNALHESFPQIPGMIKASRTVASRQTCIQPQKNLKTEEVEQKLIQYEYCMDPQQFVPYPQYIQTHQYALWYDYCQRQHQFHEYEYFKQQLRQNNQREGVKKVCDNEMVWQLKIPKQQNQDI